MRKDSSLETCVTYSYIRFFFVILTCKKYGKEKFEAK